MMADDRPLRTALAAALIALLAAPLPAWAAKRPKFEPHRLEAGRFTVVCDRRPDRLPEIARRLWAVDRVLRGWLEVPAARVDEPVTLAYLHRSKRMERRLPFRGDRPGQRHLLPTDGGVLLLVREDTGVEEIRPAVVQLAELELSRGPGDLPQWLRSGLYELLARVDLDGSTLVLEPGYFAALQATGVRRAPLDEVRLPGWSRYQDPRRWYTASLVVAYLFENDRAALATAIAAPDEFDLPAAVDEEAFEAWVDRMVLDRGTGTTVLEVGLDVPPMEPVAIADEALRTHLYRLAATHPRGPKAFGLPEGNAPVEIRAELELRRGEPAEACRALLASDEWDPVLIEGMCLWQVAPRAAEERWRLDFRRQPSAYRAAVEAAALASDDPARDAEAAALVDAALAVAPSDPDARLLRAALDARAGTCPEYSAVDLDRLAPIWAPLSYVEGPLSQRRAALVREVMECGR